MIVWVIAALLGVATGLRIGWALVNKQSLVSAAMMLALGSLAIVAALNWQPLTLLIDTVLHWPNVSIALSQVALTLCAAASCVMILSVASTRTTPVTRRLAWAQYGVALVIAAISVALFFADAQQPEMAPQVYLLRNLKSHTSLPWLLPLLYVLFALSVVSWVGIRYSTPSRRGRALFVFTIGIALIVLASGFFLLRAFGTTRFVGVGSAITLLGCAMLVVAAGSLLPSVEDWFGARRELRTIEPLLHELEGRQPDLGIGVRPRGPLVFRVAERMSLISDGLFLEAQAAAHEAASAHVGDVAPKAPPVAPREQARGIAQWIYAGRAGSGQKAFPGLGWLRQPQAYSDREWILEIASQYRGLSRQRRPDLKREPAELRRMPG